ncbi:hypothetical protein BOW55_16425 [Flavobacterium sp. YO12]|nr:hypothetical protein BOW55_16425 [Flavobacterium sp. YO12]
MNYKVLSFLVGFGIWLMATITFRLFGHYFFITDNTFILIALYIILIPVLGIIVNSVNNKYKLNKLEAIHSTVIMILPGMLLDTLCIYFFSLVFPNLPTADGVVFSSWLMWAYSIVLIFGLLRKKIKT